MIYCSVSFLIRDSSTFQVHTWSYNFEYKSFNKGSFEIFFEEE